MLTHCLFGELRVPPKLLEGRVIECAKGHGRSGIEVPVLAVVLQVSGVLLRGTSDGVLAGEGLP